MSKLKITLVKSPIGTKPNHKLNLRGLGLRKMWQSVEREDTPSIRGMINKVYFLVKVEEV